MNTTCADIASRLQELHRKAAECRPLKIFFESEATGFSRPSFLLVPWLTDLSLGPLLDTFARNHPALERVESPDQADAAVLPFDAACLIEQPYGPPNPAAIVYARTFVNEASRRGLLTLAVAAGDLSRAFPVSFNVLLRHSINRRGARTGEYCLPGWFDAAQDARPDYCVSRSPRGPRPRVGFCGQAATRDAKFALRRARQAWWRFRYGGGNGADAIDPLLLRRLVIDRVAAASEIELNFIVRGGFYASLPDKDAARREFIENIEQSDYILCIRGKGNYSFRFYDALAHGRVPVIIDTACVLPFDDQISYPDLMPFIALRDISQAGARIAEHYQRFNDEEWYELQRTLRTFYNELMAPAGYFKHLALIPEIRRRLMQAHDY